MIKFLKMNKSLVSGFTLLEVSAVIAIMGIISTIVLINLSSFRNDQVVKNATMDIVSLLDKARQKTLSSVNSTNYGVHFDTNKAVLFAGGTYSSSNVTNELLVFSTKVTIPTSGGLNIGGGSDVIFTRLTGETTGGTIKIQLISKPAMQKIITVNKTGIISSN